MSGGASAVKAVRKLINQFTAATPGGKLSLWTTGLHINSWKCSRLHQLEVERRETGLNVNARGNSYYALGKGSLMKDQLPSAQRSTGSSQKQISWCDLGFYRLSSGEQSQRGASCCRGRGSGWRSHRHHITLARHWVKSRTKIFRKKIALKWICLSPKDQCELLGRLFGSTECPFVIFFGFFCPRS